MEAGGQKLEAGRLEAVCWRLEARGWRVEAGGRNLTLDAGDEGGSRGAWYP